MAVGGVVSGSVSDFGGLANVRKQADVLRQRVEAESAARKAEQERTGLIRNPKTGDMVEISSISEETRERWEHHEAIMSVSPQEALIAALASAPLCYLTGSESENARRESALCSDDSVRANQAAASRRGA